MKLHVKKGDNVVVLAGKDKGKTGKILVANPSDNTVIVEGVNIISKNKKARSAQEKSQIVKTEGKINVSNVQIICPECNKATRVANKLVDGKNVRTCKHCGASLDGKASKKVAKTTKTEKKAEVVEEKPAKTAAKKTTTAKKSTTTTAKKAPAKKSATKTAPTKSITRNGGDK